MASTQSVPVPPRKQGKFDELRERIDALETKLRATWATCDGVGVHLFGDEPSPESSKPSEVRSGAFGAIITRLEQIDDVVDGLSSAVDRLDRL